MKKQFFYLAVSALAITACSSEDIVDDATMSRNIIGFENVVNKHSRAESDLTYGNLTQFNVFGYYTTPDNADVAVEVFHDVPVFRQENLTWSYKTSEVDYRYWVKDAHYYFYAYSCGSISKLNSNYGTFTMDMTNKLPPSNRVLTINGYVCNASHQHDLIYASNTGAVEGNQWNGITASEVGNDIVSFQFKHILSKVQAKFTSKFPEDYTVQISNVSIENIRTIGDYNPNGGWKNVERDKNGESLVYLLYSQGTDATPITTAKGKEPAVTNTAYVIPFVYNGKQDTPEDETEAGSATTESTYAYLKFTLTLFNKEEKILTKILTGRFNPNWLSGYSYVYNVEVSGDAADLQAIAFETTTDENGKVVSDWSVDKDNKEPVIIVDNND